MRGDLAVGGVGPPIGNRPRHVGQAAPRSSANFGAASGQFFTPKGLISVRIVRQHGLFPRSVARHRTNWGRAGGETRFDHAIRSARLSARRVGRARPAGGGGALRADRREARRRRHWAPFCSAHRPVQILIMSPRMPRSRGAGSRLGFKVHCAEPTVRPNPGPQALRRGRSSTCEAQSPRRRPDVGRRPRPLHSRRLGASDRDWSSAPPRPRFPAPARISCSLRGHNSNVTSSAARARKSVADVVAADDQVLATVGAATDYSGMTLG
jgi:hypothetical protein